MDVSTLLMLAICVAVGGLPGTMGWVPATTGVGGKLIWSAYDKPLLDGCVSPTLGAGILCSALRFCSPRQAWRDG